jgi:CRISPR-associated protein Csb1
MMSTQLTQFDDWLDDNGPAAVVIREYLMPVEGEDGIVFPATFAPSEDKSFKGGYNIDDIGDGHNVCLIDSVGSQANRIEPLFAKDDYKTLVPQIVISAGTRKVNLLEAGHRAGDAIIRCSSLQKVLQDAFKAGMKGNVLALAKIAPTSLVFGVWDSRDTQAKLPRLIASTIRAFDVQRLTRSAQYVPAAEYVSDGLLDESDDRKVTDAYAAKGFVHVPASGSPGGVIAKSIRRDATLHLAALRLLAVGSDTDATCKLQRYVLGLALTAFTHVPSGYLRQGCNLVPNPERPRQFEVVGTDGKRAAADVSHANALAYAREAAKAFGVGEDQDVAFSVELAKADVSETGGKKAKASKGKK